MEHAQDDDEIIDWDKIVKDFKVEDNKIAKQITLDLLKDAINYDGVTWFVCTVPTFEQQQLLNLSTTKYLWLFADIQTTLDNLRRRNRRKDIKNLKTIYAKNVELTSIANDFIEKHNAKIV